jgi:hypothetical protein
MGPHEILRRCVMEVERPLILTKSHEGITRDTTQGNQLHKRFLELAFGGLPYTETLKTFAEPPMYAKELGNHTEEMK